MERREDAWKDVLGAREYIMKERGMQIYREEKRNKCVYIVSENVKKFGRKLNHDVSGNKKVFGRKGGEVENCSRLRDRTGKE